METTRAGDLYVLRMRMEASVEWLAVRHHLDDLNLWFVVPTDDMPLAGTPDVKLAYPRIARCGEGTWVRSERLEARYHVGGVTAEELRLVRDMVAGMARGRLPGGVSRASVDAEPEYQRWMDDLRSCVAEVGV